MKVILALAAVLTVAVAHDLEEMLPHFPYKKLSSDFQKFHLSIPESCGPEINQSNFRLHQLGRRCYHHFWIHQQDVIQACMNRDDLKDTVKQWQETSFKWHEAVQKCLNGEDPPEDEEDTFFLFRKKRNVDDNSNDDDSDDDDSEDDDDKLLRMRRNAKKKMDKGLVGIHVCRRDMKQLKQEVDEAIAACPQAARCFGVGDEPTDENQKKWFNYIKDLAEQKKNLMPRDQMKQCFIEERDKLLEKHLPAYKMAELSDNMKSYQPYEGMQCHEKVWSCIEHVHGHAKMCVMQAQKEYPEELAACKQQDGYEESDSAWMTASFKYHKLIDQCLSGEEPPADDDDKFMLLFRKKRNAPGHGHGHSYHHEMKFDTSKKCWEELKKHEKKCMRKAATCPKLAACMGIGDAPTNENLLAWYNVMKEVKDDKTAKVTQHIARLAACVGEEEAKRFF
jgi:hypothetical protein